ncbi:MAG TPA: TonB-dependent receptor [Terriglobales bacterium]|nr:TonB-dependent receptor [Terriglobales bacterium]
MRHPGFVRLVVRAALTLILSSLLFVPCALLGQASYQAQIRGVVTDPTGAVLPNATVTITDVGTNVSQTARTDHSGTYILRALRPSTYTVKVQAAGFGAVEQKGVVLAVDQETSLNFTLRPAATTTTVEVREAAPLLDTGSSSLGTEVTNEYVKEIPLLNRNFFGLVFLNAGVSETAGSGIADNYPSGTNFVSNGQRNATAEVRMDGALITAPEEGEGGNSNVFYEPSVEAVQEFKVQNNAFSAEFGSNGGTVVNMALKSGTNGFHGSGWWFGQRGDFDANDFFSNQAGLPRPDHSRDQYGMSLGGPIRRNKTFFFVDIERVLEVDPVPILATVPTAAERVGNFSQALITDPNTGNIVPNLIFNPFMVSSQPCPGDPTTLCSTRPAFTGNKIPQNLWDSVGQKLLNLYPLPNQPGNPDGTNNFRTNTNIATRSLQFDAKVDEQTSTTTHLAARFSHAHYTTATPTVLGDGEFNDGANYLTSVENGGLQFDWTIKPTLLLSSRFGLDYVHAPGYTNYPPATSVGFPASLDQANDISRMPAILVDSPWTSIYDQCCVDTKLNHYLYSYSSALAWTKGKHNIKFGGEQRIFFNNFQEPNYATGYFHFAQTVTENVIGALNPDQGNPFADILLGIGDYGGIGIDPEAFNKSKDTSFYTQDDWRVTPKLTLNLGLRYEWSTPYTERFNHIEFSDFNANSGVTVDLSSGNAGLQALGLGPTQLTGITKFPTSSQRNVPVDRNNWAPRLGFAYQLTKDTVVRGGAGIYYGMNVATNYQYVGTAFRKDGVVYFTKNGLNCTTGVRSDCQYATLEDPFPAGLPAPQGEKYGPLAEWGFPNANDLGTTAAINADIYQWSFGVQRLLPGQLVVSVDYSANHSTHLPWGGSAGATTRDHNFIPTSIRSKFSQNGGCNPDGTVNFSNTYAYNNLQCLVPNPFYSMFVGPNAIFNEPDSLYDDPQIPLINLLRPHPQFNGTFEGLPLLEAESFYNALQIRFQKRASHYISFEGGYTLSKATDDSSSGRNAWVGGLAFDNPQELDNLKAEHSISANDATHRLALAIIGDIPIGRGRWIGSGMNRFLDGVIGGWTLSAILTQQSGQPIDIGMSEPSLDDGNQRPEVICNPSTGISSHRSALSQASANPLSTLNSSCFASPGLEQAGNAPRFFSNLRTDGIHNIDLSIEKSFVPHEGMRLELRGEFFNFFNTPRFAIPDNLWGDSTFGQISSLAMGSTPRHGQVGVRLEF